MKMVISHEFFNRPTLQVAKDLLGKFLVCRIGRKTISGMITEVEAYMGIKDKASHASYGITERTKVMFGKPGYWYVYLIYGMYYCLNIVTQKEGYPAAILIRGIQARDKKINGPGRVCRYLKIDKSFNNKIATRKTGLWIEERGKKQISLNSRVEASINNDDSGIAPGRSEKRTASSFQNIGFPARKINPGQIGRGKRVGVNYAGRWKDKPWRFYLLSKL